MKCIESHSGWPPSRWRWFSQPVEVGAKLPMAPAASADLVAAVSLEPYADLVTRVGGDRVDVRSVVPAGLDGHTYEPTPSDARTLADADIVFLPGAELNPRVTELAHANVTAGADSHQA